MTDIIKFPKDRIVRHYSEYKEKIKLYHARGRVIRTIQRYRLVKYALERKKKDD